MPLHDDRGAAVELGVDDVGDMLEVGLAPTTCDPMQAHLKRSVATTVRGLSGTVEIETCLPSPGLPRDPRQGA